MASQKHENNLPLVSIVIPVYNGSNFMREAIDSALAQTYPHTEVIVVNDGSTDNGKTDAIAKSYGNKIRYFVKENGGVSSALNFVIQKLLSDNTQNEHYFSWLSHDDLYAPDKISKQIQVLQGHNPNTLVFSNFKLVDEQGQTISETHFETKIKPSQFQGIYPVLKGMTNGDSILINLNAFKEHGLFNEESKDVGDYEKWLELFQTYDQIFLPEPLISYRIHKDQDTNKSLVYNSESDAFWVSAIGSITSAQAKKWNISLFQIYADLYIQMKKSNFRQAAALAYDLAKQHFKQSPIAISILMPTFNSEKYLKESIESVLNSDFGNFELVIIDDGSADNTVNIAESYTKQDFRIKLIKNSKNHGAAKALNQGLQHARGKYFTRLDSDDLMAPDRLLKQYLVLEEQNYQLCATNISLVDEKGKITNPKSYPPLIAPLHFATLFTNPIPNATILYRMDIVQKHNLQFPDLTVAEDYQFLLSFLHYGTGTMIDESLYSYRIHDDSLFHNNQQLSLEYGYSACSSYSDYMINDFSHTLLHRTINDFHPSKQPFTTSDFLTVIQEGENAIGILTKKYHYTTDEQNRCRLFLHLALQRLATPTDFPEPPLTPLRKLYYYYLDNGIKGTLLRAFGVKSKKKTA